MSNDALRIIRAFVLGFIFCFSSGASADSRASQQLFDKGSALIKQDKINQGIGLLKRAAAQGHGQAAFDLASLHEVGLVVEQDLRKAKRFYELSIREGYRDAHFNLALLLSSPMTPNNDLKRARSVVEVIAEQGDVEAQYLLATLMKKGMQNVSAKPGKAFYWLQHAANSGHAKAQFALGTQYLKGQHVSRSRTTALKWFNRAAMQRVPEAHYNLALMHEKGEGVEANMAKAIDFYRSAAELGSADAQHNLGIKYLTADYLEPSPKRAINLLTSASNSGSGSAQLLLGQLYQSGYQDSIKVDLEKAEHWYLKAAKQGKSEAQYQLALMFLDKDSGEEEADFWIQRAVAAGHIKATQLQANL